MTAGRPRLNEPEPMIIVEIYRHDYEQLRALFKDGMNATKFRRILHKLVAQDQQLCRFMDALAEVKAQLKAETAALKEKNAAPGN